VDAFLDEVADTAEAVAAEQHQVAQELRSLQRARERGVSWAEAVDQPAAGPGPLGRLRDSRRKLAAAARRLAQGLAEGLRSEGQSYRAIAGRLGVTHQRVSAMLTRRAGSGDPRV
jgi:cell division septum initiation protein DivIVA